MKKLLKVLMISMLALTLVACGGTEDKGTGGDAGSDEGKTYEVGVVIYQFQDNFMTLYREEIQAGFKDAGEKDGNTYNVDVQDSKNDQATQTEQVRNFITQQKDLLIVNLVDPTAAGVIISEAKDADIPVIFINREPDTDVMREWPEKTTYIGVDATQSGRYQGDIIYNLDNHGDVNGDGVVSYITLMGDPQNVDAQQRTEFSIKQLEENGQETQNLKQDGSYVGNWDTQQGEQLASDALTQFGDDLEVIFANNDGMAMGAIVAAQKAERVINEDIYIVGVDAIPDAMAALEDGTLTGTVLNDHYNQARTVVDIAISKALAGEAMSSYYWHDYLMVNTPEDAEPVRADFRAETVEEVEARYEAR
ncbi:MAG TPA: galactose ABC transporter substrate-binding protein [Erysipelotrichaceae bacterium]|nr:galactose ABC transporter substrate-binding protein [Erysipelotrichaceae bacterium]